MLKRWVLVGSVAGLALLVSAVSVAWACVPQGVLTLNPASGPAGSQVTASTTGFPVGEAVDIHWDSQTGPVLASGTGPTFTKTITIPADAAGGTHIVVAAVTDEHAAHSAAPAAFTVPADSPNPAPGPGPGPGPGSPFSPFSPVIPADPFGAAAPASAPSVSGYRLTNRTFVMGGSTPIFGVAAANKHVKGTTFKYTLSEAATVRIVMSQGRSGRRMGRRCVAPTGKLRKAKKCTRLIVNGTLTRTSHQGANSVAFSGRIGYKALNPGRYQATLTATDAAKNASAPKSVTFAIVKR